jgi:chromate transporter
VSWQLARTSIVDFVTATIALVSAIALIRFRINSTWLVLMGALAGLLFHSGIG